MERMLKERKQFVREHFLLHVNMAAAGEVLLELRIPPWLWQSVVGLIFCHYRYLR